jgi:predicted nucleic acid-binding protein
MPFVVVDTSVSLPATLSPGGLARRFWIVLALGALTYEVEHRRLELDELSRRAEREGGVVRGVDQARARIEEADDRRAALLELLPYGTPDDWVAIGSTPLFDEYERKLREIGAKLDPALREEDIPRLRRQLESVCVAGAPPFASKTVPLLTRDRKDDAILYTALIGNADLLVSDDRDLVPDRHEQLWEYEDRLVTAVTFNTLVTERLDTTDWLNEIDGSWLAVAHGQAL